MLEIKTRLSKRKQYLLIILPVFALGFLVYTALVCYGVRYGFNSPISPVVYGIMGGYLFASIVSGIILFIRFIKNKPLWVKVLCAVLFLPVFIILYFIGAITLIPYFFYNVICFVVDTKKIKRLELNRVPSILRGEIIEQLMQDEIKNVEYEKIKEKLRLYNKINSKISGLTGVLVGGGLILLFRNVGLLQNLVALIAIAVGFAYLEEKRIYTRMRKQDHYNVGLLYVGYDEEFFGIFHGENGLVRKSLRKYRMLKNVEMNGINTFIYNSERKIMIIYR